MKKGLLLFMILIIILLLPAAVYAYPYPKIMDGPLHTRIIYENNGGIEIPLEIESACSVGDKVYFLTYNALYRMELDGSDIDVVFAYHSSIIGDQRELTEDELEKAQKYPALMFIVSNSEGILYGYDGDSWYEITDNGDGYCTEVPYTESILDDALRNSESIYMGDYENNFPVDVPAGIDTYAFDSEHQMLYYLKDGFLYRKCEKEEKCIRHIPIIINSTSTQLLYINESTVAVYNEYYMLLLGTQEEITLKNRLSIEYVYPYYFYPAICAVQYPELQVELVGESDKADIMFGSTLDDEWRDNCLLIPLCDSLSQSLSEYDPVIRNFVFAPEGVYALPVNFHCSLWRIDLSSETADYLNRFSTYNDFLLNAKDKSPYDPMNYYQARYMYPQSYLLMSDYIYQSIVQGICPDKACIEKLCQVILDWNGEETLCETACINEMFNDMSDFTELNYELFRYQAPLPVDQGVEARINAWMEFAYIDPLTQNREVAVEYIKGAFASQNKEIKYLLNPYTESSPDTGVNIENYRKLQEAEAFLVKTEDYFGLGDDVLHDKLMNIQSLEQMLSADSTKLFSNNAEETYKKLFSQFDFTRTKEITPGIMDVLSLYIYDFLSGDMTVSEMYTNLFENME